VGAVDIITTAGVGQVFSTTKQAVEAIITVLEREQSEREIFEISNKASMFDPESFKDQIKKLVK
jgi:hypothetical protein